MYLPPPLLRFRNPDYATEKTANTCIIVVGFYNCILFYECFDS